MEKSKLSKEDKKAIAITLIIGAIAQIFIDSAMDISVLCFCIYILHKYIGTTENIREYDSYEFSDKSKFDKKKRVFVWLVDIYIVIRIIFILLKPQSTYIFCEILLIIMIYTSYERYLNKKYVICTNIFEEEKSVVFARRKILLTIGMIVFIVFSVGTFNKISTQDSVKYGKYEYKLSNIENKRKIEVIKIGSDYMMSEESDGNSKYFDTFIQKTKSLMKKQVFKSYFSVGMVFCILLCFIEAYPKSQNIISIAGNILIIIALIFSILSFNIDTNKEQLELSSYFHEYMSR
nr:hypothetical protein [uncultured Romboutsia sp.]